MLAWSGSGQDFAAIEIQKVATGYAFAEGPAWSPMGFLVFSDIPNNKLMQFTPWESASVYRGLRGFN